MTWFTDLLQLATAFGVVLNGIGVCLSWWQSRQNAKKIDQNAKEIEKVHLATNSMKDELVKVTGEAEFAKGLAQGANASRP